MTEAKPVAKPAAAPAAPAPPAAPAAPGATTAAPAGTKGPALPLLIAIAAGALVAGAALGWFLVAPRVVAARRAVPVAKAAHEPAEADDKKESKGHGEKGKAGHEKPSTYRMDNIIVNPAASNGTRFLMASVAVELDDPKLNAMLKERDVELRDAVISTIERQTLEDLTRPGARDTLRSQLVKSLTPIIGQAPRVFLPQFVLQ